MFRKFRTLEQCKYRYRAVTADGSVWRVKERGLFGIGWTFVCEECIDETTYGLLSRDKPVFFSTELDVQTAIDKWAWQDYAAQPAAWK